MVYLQMLGNVSIDQRPRNGSDSPDHEEKFITFVKSHDECIHLVLSQYTQRFSNARKLFLRIKGQQTGVIPKLIRSGKLRHELTH